MASRYIEPSTCWTALRSVHGDHCAVDPARAVGQQKGDDVGYLVVRAKPLFRQFVIEKSGIAFRVISFEVCPASAFKGKAGYDWIKTMALISWCGYSQISSPAN